MWTGDCIDAGTGVATIRGLECAFSNVVSVVAEFALLVAFIMLVIGGFKYLTSGGDAKAVDSAKHTITYAVFGLVAFVLIWLVLKLISVITGINLTVFQIPR